MNAATIAVIVFMATFGVLFFYGHRVLQKRKKKIEEIVQNEDQNVREISYVSYHGGLKTLPKARKLTLALSGSALFLVSDKGEKAKLSMQDWLKVEKFTTSRKHDVKQRSMVTWGPFNNVLFKDQIRHFIVINYRDENGNPDNNVLIEHGNKDQRDDIFREINTAWDHYRRLDTVKNRGRMAGIEIPSVS